jgi:predicted ester cyclase
MPADHKATSRQILEQWGDNTVHKSLEFIATNYANHQMPDAAESRSTKSLEEWKELAANFHKGFSDAKMEILMQVAEGDYVCTRWRITAKHTGEFAGYQPTGKTSTWTGVQTDRYEGDKLVESWVDWDKYSWLEGLGLVG